MFGDYLKSLREARELSQRQLAHMASLSNTEISKLESGERKKPSPAVLKKLAPHLKVSYEELLKAAGIIEMDGFVYTPPEDAASLENFIREFGGMDKDQQYETMKELFGMILKDDNGKKKKGKK